MPTMPAPITDAGMPEGHRDVVIAEEAFTDNVCSVVATHRDEWGEQSARRFLRPRPRRRTGESVARGAHAPQSHSISPLAGYPYGHGAKCAPGSLARACISGRRRGPWRPVA